MYSTSSKKYLKGNNTYIVVVVNSYPWMLKAKCCVLMGFMIFFFCKSDLRA